MQRLGVQYSGVPAADAFQFGSCAVTGWLPGVLVPAVADYPVARAQSAGFDTHAFQALLQRASLAVHSAQLIREEHQVEMGIGQTRQNGLPLQINLFGSTAKCRAKRVWRGNRADNAVFNQQGLQAGLLRTALIKTAVVKQHPFNH